MRPRVTVTLVVLIAGVMFWLAGRRPTERVPQPTSSATSPSKPTVRSHAASANPAMEGNPDVPEETSTTNSPLPGPVAAKAKTVTVAALEETPAAPEPDETRVVLAPATALENMRTVLRQYALRFGGNPIGNNREITAAVSGQNPRQVVFLNPDDGLQINARGELVDNWGTPYFFHQLSATEMEIRSAGPDRKMWTADDLMVR